MNEYDYPNRWIKMKVEDLLTPKEGRVCYGPRWWAVTEDDCVLFYKSYNSPQCNTVKSICEHIRPDCRVEFFDIAFVPHKCEDW